jgi:hypothetical protein
VSALRQSTHDRLEVAEVRIVPCEKQNFHASRWSFALSPTRQAKIGHSAAGFGGSAALLVHTSPRREQLPQNVLDILCLTYVARRSRSAANLTRDGVVCQSAANP